MKKTSSLVVFALLTLLSCSSNNQNDTNTARPNIILCMADDMGWGDLSYTGNSISITPSLDMMASEGVVFTRFYSSSPVCSPTRGSCITGRHPYRYGVFFANSGHMPALEVTIAEVLKEHGYATGHFGKWHLGTLTKTEKDANRGGSGDTTNYSPPWDNGFDVSFSTESKVPTWNPMITPGKDAGDIGRRTPGDPFGTAYWVGPGQKATDNLEGDDARIIMDRVIPFIENAANDKKPFLAVIWFHNPHLPALTGDEYKSLYSDYSEDIQNYYGCITAMDKQIGRLRTFLTKRSLSGNTIMFFTSDNGPEGPVRKGRTQGTAGILKGRKRSLHEGGVRVPGLMIWPDMIKSHRSTDIPFSTLDYFPTVMDVLGYQAPSDARPIDGISILPFVKGEMHERRVSIGFESRKQLASMNDRYKIYSSNNGKNFELYDIVNDPGETIDISGKNPEIVKELSEQLHEWRESCKNSLLGNDY
ncbi:MAG: sulfatase-like hydrolase/transferase [Bacteroidales bacterium]|nr:sulfatase-like hydrolase/transferase [Bacteroidales bacterium]